MKSLNPPARFWGRWSLRALDFFRVGVFSLGAMSGLGALGAAADVGERSQPPNIILIVADDLGYGDLSCYGQERFSTPHIDRLAENGMRFTQHYSGSPVCAPSRAVLLTGFHTGHVAIRGNREVYPEGQIPLSKEAVTLPELLKLRGYVTGAFGKWGLGYPGSEGDPNEQGFDEFFGYKCQRIAHHYYPWSLWRNEEMVPLPENRKENPETYAPDLIHRETLRFIESHRDQPFFLFVATPLPHAELAVPESYMERYRDRFLPEKTYHRGGYDSGEPRHIENEYLKGTYASQPESHAAFAGMVTCLDDQVGSIMAKLEELSLSEDTLVVFTSDNGPHLEGGADPEYFDSNGPLRGFKRDLYEGGIRVPMIAWGPGLGVPGGATSDHASAFWDNLPTLCEIAGAPVPSGIDGISYAPTLLGNPERQEQHDYLYWEFNHEGGRAAIRQGDWKLIQYGIEGENGGVPELYDLADIGETQDLAARFPDRVERLMALMREASRPSPIEGFTIKGVGR